VNPKASVAWYLTQYDAISLFTHNNTMHDSKVAVMALFAEKDDIPGVQSTDANTLLNLLE